MSKKINEQIAESARENEWRFEGMFHLGALAQHDALPSVFRDAIDEDLVEIAKAVGVPGTKALRMEDGEFVEYVLDKNLRGMLVQVATPVREYFEGDDSNSYSFSWGHYGTAWLYGEDLEALLPKIEAWVKERSEEDRRKSARKVA
ncbi:hypothetical protein ACXIVK_27795 [Paraburkholderia caledonica]|jgi:hypothetical protein